MHLKLCGSLVTFVPIRQVPQTQPQLQPDDSAWRESAERERQRAEQEQLRQHREWARAQALAAAPAKVPELPPAQLPDTEPESDLRRVQSQCLAMTVRLTRSVSE